MSEVSIPAPQVNVVVPPQESPDVTMENQDVVQKSKEDLVKVFLTAGVKLDKVASWAVKRKRRDILKLHAK